MALFESRHTDKASLPSFIITMSTNQPVRQIIVDIVRQADGKYISMNIPDNVGWLVKHVKSHLRQQFHPYRRFRLYYKGRHIKSRHTLEHYGICSDARRVKLILL
jgi:hypothetical protein